MEKGYVDEEELFGPGDRFIVSCNSVSTSDCLRAIALLHRVYARFMARFGFLGLYAVGVINPDISSQEQAGRYCILLPCIRVFLYH